MKFRPYDTNQTKFVNLDYRKILGEDSDAVIIHNIVEDIEDLIEKTIIERKKDESIIECIDRTKSELDKKPNMKFKSPHY